MKASGKSSEIVGSRRKPSLTTSPRALRSRAGEVVGMARRIEVEICPLSGQYAAGGQPGPSGVNKTPENRRKGTYGYFNTRQIGGTGRQYYRKDTQDEKPENRHKDQDASAKGNGR